MPLKKYSHIAIKLDTWATSHRCLQAVTLKLIRFQRGQAIFQVTLQIFSQIRAL